MNSKRDFLIQTNLHNINITMVKVMGGGKKTGKKDDRGRRGTGNLNRNWN